MGWWDFGFWTMGLWDIGNMEFFLIFSSSHFLIVFFWTMGLWDYGTSQPTNKQSVAVSVFTFHFIWRAPHYYLHYLSLPTTTYKI